MTANSNHSTLKQLLINRISLTDDDALLQQCFDLLEAHKKEQLGNNESDEAAEETAAVETPTPSPFISRRLLRFAIGSLLAILVIAGGAWAYKTLKGWWSSGDSHEGLVTVAERYETITVGNVSFNMVYVEGGTFMMGTPEREGNDPEEYQTDNDERPLHQVTLSSFMIGETEVTEGLWIAVMGSAPLPNDGDNHPVKKVSWKDCQLFIDSLNKLTGRTFSLPTEAQWEFAARGGNRSQGYKFAGSDSISDVAWHAANAWDKGKGDPDFGSHNVGALAPNELGLYDMSGNVWEWVQDCYGPYSTEAQTDPQGPTGDRYSYRVNRGGSWDYIATSSRSTNRRNRTPDFRNFNLGLRLALSVDSVPTDQGE